MTAIDGDTLLLEARIAHATDSIDRVDALNALARQLAEGGSERSFQLSEDALATARALGYAAGVASALRNRASCYLVRSDYGLSERDYQEALALTRTHALAALEAGCLLGLSTLRRKELDYVAAEALLREGLRRAQDAPDGRTEAGCWINLSSLCRELSRFPEAVDAARRGGVAAVRAGDRSAALFCRTNELITRCESGQSLDCVEALEDCLKDVEADGHNYLRAHLLAVLSDAYLKANRIEEALQTNEVALRLAHAHCDLQLEMLLLLTLGHILEALGLLLPADAAYERAARRAQQVQDSELLARAIGERALCQERQGNFSAAHQLFAELEALAESTGAYHQRWEAIAGRRRIEDRELSLLEGRLQEDSPEDTGGGGDPEQRPEHGGDSRGVLEVHRIGRGC